MKVILDTYNDLEEEMKELNNNMLPLNEYIEKQKAIDETLKKYVQTFKEYEL